MELSKWKSNGVPSFSGLLDEFFNKELNLFGDRSMHKSVPAVNIRETEDKFILELAAPGVNKDEFNVEVTPENLLRISSETSREKNEKDDKGQFTLKEFSYHSFSRSFKLPDSVDADQINANYKNGLLEVILQKKTGSQPKTIRSIKVE